MQNSCTFRLLKDTGVIFRVCIPYILLFLPTKQFDSKMNRREVMSVVHELFGHTSYMYFAFLLNLHSITLNVSGITLSTQKPAVEKSYIFSNQFNPGQMAQTGAL